MEGTTGLLKRLHHACMFTCASTNNATCHQYNNRNQEIERRSDRSFLTTLETRRLRGDQIEVFKILNGYENIDRNIFFSVKEERRTRGHGITLAKKQCRLDIRKF